MLLNRSTLLSDRDLYETPLNILDVIIADSEAISSLVIGQIRENTIGRVLDLSLIHI